MKHRLQAALIVTALLATGWVRADEPDPSEADWRWLSNEGWQAINSLMPLGESPGVTVTFRSYRDSHRDVPEQYFRMSQDFSTDRALTARVVTPVGRSLQLQLLALHMHAPSATAAALLSEVVVSETELDERSCPELRVRMDKVAKLKITVPAFDRIVLHPTNYKVILRTGLGDIKADLVDETQPLVQWALQTHEILQQCALEARESKRP